MPDVAEDVYERPIIFNEWSITRILAGAKTQTRRLTGLDEINEAPDEWEPVNQYRSGTVDFQRVSTHRLVGSPYGQPGDVLWVREAFRFPTVNDAISPSEYVGAGCDVWRYEADGEIHDPGEWTEKHDYEWGRKRPSIHMPRELCRLRLRVEDVFVERVCDIGAADCAAEGIPDDPSFETDNPIAHATKTTMRERFQQKWIEIHGDGAWDEDSWAWCISFSRISD